MSLFGTDPKPVASLLANPWGTPASTAQSQPGQTASVFANLNNPQQQSQATPLSGLGASSKPATSSNPFGNIQPQPQPTNTRQLFSVPQKQNQTQANQPSIFGPKPEAGPNTQNSQGDGQSRQNTEGGQQATYFTSLLEKNKKRQRGAQEESNLGDVPSLQLGFGDLRKRIRELAGGGVQSQEKRGADSKAHYLLAASGVNPGTTVRDLDNFNVHSSAAAAIQTPVGWDPDSHRYVEQLQQQSTLKMIAEGISRTQCNFDAYVEENIDINWEAQRKKIYEHFGLTPKGDDGLPGGISYPNLRGRGSFGRSGRGGRGSTANPPGQGTPNRSIFGRSGMQKSVIGTPGTGSGNPPIFIDVAEKASQIPLQKNDRHFREKQEKFAEKVQQLNAARLQEHVYPVLHEFAYVEGQSAGESPSQLIDAYKALIEIVHENPNVTSLTDPRAIKQRQWANEYLDESLNTAAALKIRTTIINGSRKALEKQFYQGLESLVVRNPREASLGGVPTVINKVRAYIRIRNARKDLAPDGVELQILNDDYCWALVFFLLRSGFVKEAAEYVTGNANAFRAIDPNFVTWITTFASNANRRLPRGQHAQINTDYQRRVRVAPEGSLDPYRAACIKVIGRCELSKRSIDSISQGVEDWIWLQFSLAREVNRAEEVANEVYGLAEVQETIKEIGERHFSKGSEGPGGYGTYFFLQILGGLFENAVAYLYAHSYVAAVHFAIALDFYGLLRVSDFSLTEPELLTYDTKEHPQISFGRMMGYYTRDFRASNVVAAVDYLALICLNADLLGDIGKSQASLCHEALRELVLETREFAQLLGDIRSDGTRIKGAIEQRLKIIGIADQEAFLRTVTLQAASVADDNGRTTDAVLLYHLAEDYDNVIIIINRALSDSIVIDIDQEALRLQPLKPRAPPQHQQQLPDGSSLSLTTVDNPSDLARNMISLYNSNALYYQRIRSANRDSCGVLLRISEAKAKVAVGSWAEALDIISSLSLLPLNANSSIPVIRSHAQTLTSLPSTISRLIGPLLLWTMTCISRQRELLSGDGGQGGFESDTRRAMREELVGKAKDLMVFAGLVKLRLGKGVWDGIVGGAGDVGVY